MQQTPPYSSESNCEAILTETTFAQRELPEQTAPTWKELWFERNMLTSVRRVVSFAALLGAMFLFTFLYAFTLAYNVPDPTPPGFHDLGNSETCLRAVIQELRARRSLSR